MENELIGNTHILIYIRTSKVRPLECYQKIREENNNNNNNNNNNSTDINCIITDTIFTAQILNSYFL